MSGICQFLGQENVSRPPPIPACLNGMLCAACDNEWFGETRWILWQIEYAGALQTNG
jgi:hypothetical protein